ncbi:MAG: methyl-accepting chemotaxis protein [Gammaproteobacteria bacterium]|nr:methyl-accepting chemotaxis protein [Gammaproteobacteria bacterium]
MFATIRFKSYLFVGIFGVALLCQVAVQHIQTGHIRSQALFLSDTQTKIIDNLHQMQVAVIQIQQWLTDISATRGQDGLDDGFDEAAKSAELFRSSLGTLQRIDGGSNIEYQSLLPVMEAYYATGRKMAQAYIDGGAPAGNKIMGEFDITAAAIYGRIDELAEKINRNATEQFAIQLAEADESNKINLIFAAMYLLLLLGALFGIHQFILKPVQAVLTMARDLSQGEGDLTQRLVDDGQHELSHLAKAFNAFIARTDDMVSQVTKSVVRLIPMAKELANTNHNLEQAALGQREDSQHVAKFMEKTRASADEVSRIVQQISGSVKQSVDTLDMGRHAAQDAIQSMDRLAREIGLTSDALNHLRKDSEQIESIIDVINSISEQTNLLALNAAIEAARAGEAGRGFAVVADEVRTLANRTKESTLEVQSMIHSIQNGTKQASSAMEQGIASSQHSVDQVNKSASIIDQLAGVMAEIDLQAAGIARETRHQNDHFNGVSESITAMQSDFNSSLAHLDENLDFSDDMNKLSDKLQSMVGKFKVTDSNWSTSVRSKDRPTEQEWQRIRDRATG